MNDENHITADEQQDIELTAYALDELDANRRAAVEERLAEEPALRERVAEIQAGADGVGLAFAAEAVPAAAEPPVSRSPWLRRGMALAACLGLAGGTAWVLDRGVRGTGQHAVTNAPMLPVKTPGAVSLADEDEAAADKAGFIDGHALKPNVEWLVPDDTKNLTMRPLVASAGAIQLPGATQHTRIIRIPTDQDWVETSNSAPITLDDLNTNTNDIATRSSVWNEAHSGDGRGGVVANDNSSGVDLTLSKPGTESWAYGVDELGLATPQSANEPDAALQQFLRDVEGLGRRRTAGQQKIAWTSVESSDAETHVYFDRRLVREPAAAPNETYAPLVDNPFRSPLNDPLSTFSIDVDTASYANVRRMLTTGQQPPADAVRIEEFVNTFDYGYAPPAADAEAPFATHVDVTASPWTPEHRLVRIGLKGKEIATDDRPAANLVFLLDVSGSMKSAKKLPLVKDGLRKLVAALRMDDRIAIVVYAGASGLVLDSTSDHDAVLAAIDSLTPGGSTHGSAGIELAYDVATQHFIDGGLNRVVLCTDGDFNVGITDRSRLTTLIEEKAATGTYLSILGFGAGNLKDATMEELSNAGDGNYGYIDSPKEAERLLAQQVNGTLLTIAKDVKIQVEFNPAKVASYRLIGYANRMLKKEDFNNDTVDAGDIGSGHTVTALYEVVPVGVAPPTPAVDPLKYAARPEPAAALANGSDELLTVKLRYKAPDAPKEQGTSKLLAVPVTDGGDGFDTADADARFAAAVAGFGMLLRQSEHAGDLDLSQVAEMARAANAAFAGDPAEAERRSAFVELVERAQTLAELAPAD